MDVLKQLETLPEKLRQKLEAEGSASSISSVLPSSHASITLLMASCSNASSKVLASTRGKVAQQSARSTVAHVVADRSGG
jgi:hypothetical protein